MKRNLMKWFKSFPVYGVAAALVLGAFAGCLKDPVHENPGEGRENVQITVDIPAPIVPSTRAGLPYDTEVESIDILVFEKNSTPGEPDVLAERAVGANLVQSDDEDDDYQVTFITTLTPNPDATTIVVIADASAAVTAALAAEPVGSEKQDVLSALTYEYGESGDVPMYGEKELTGGVKHGLKISGLSLVRALARVTIENETGGGFEITSVFVNSNDTGYIAPGWDTDNGDLLAGLPDTPVVPTGAQMVYRYMPGDSDDLSELYLHESPKSNGEEGSSGHVNSAFVIIGGRMNGVGKSHYYRVDFTENTDAAGKQPGEAGFDPSTVAYLPLLRNHLYQIKISAVEGEGYANEGDARKSLGVLSNLKTTLHVVDQSGIKNMVFNGQHYIGLETNKIEVASTGGDVSVEVSSNHYRGWETLRDKDNGHAQGIEYVDGANWIKAAGGGDFVAIESGAAGKFPLSFRVDPNPDPTPRTAYIYISLNTESIQATWRLVHRITVTQAPVVLPDPPAGMTEDPATGGGGRPISTNTYVGAFWKANEKGERLIKIPIATTATAGTWKVRVYSYGGEGIYPLGSNGEPADSAEGVSTDFKKGDIIFGAYDGTIPASIGDPEANPVTGGEEFGGTVASGGEIAFRIGLKQTWDGAAPRYAVAVITYGFRPNNPDGYHQLLFLRQGHQDDYVMLPTDAVTGVPITPDGEKLRPLARKWSPYNLTAAAFKGAGISSDATQTTDGGNSWVNVRSTWGAASSVAVPADYPTQAGAYFKSAHPEGVRAYNPSGNPSGTASWGWGTSSTVTVPWAATDPVNGGTIGDNYESCPEGYRRPTDGGDTNHMDVTGEMDSNKSETFQSLFSNLPTFTDIDVQNSVWGRYADGFFDRQTIVKAVGTNANTTPSAVSIDNSAVAYIGRLFHNPATHNSLFFPASGSRNHSSGKLYFTGNYGYYWSSSSYSTSHGWDLAFRSGNANRGRDDRSNGFPVRCVVDEGEPEDPMPDPPGGMTEDTTTGGGGRQIGDKTYVGAFWRAGEKGERLIKIPVTAAAGRWAVRVYSYGGDGIYPLSAMGNPADSNEGVGTDFKKGDIIFGAYDGTIPASVGNPEANPVTGGEEFGGTVDNGGEIAFRIGLKQTWNGAAPRYAVAVITYGFRPDNPDGYHQLMFLRQGHQDDYVMYPGDAASTITPVDGKARPMARKFSPYNLTAQEFMDSPVGSGTDYIDIGTKGGAFTRHPTQAGGFFHWADGEGVWAYNPVSGKGWTTHNASGAWDSFGGIYEGCPEGYSRPQEGNTATIEMGVVDVNESQIFQSLYSKTQGGNSGTGNTENSVWGYYADGFFDRQAIETAPGDNPASTAVSASSSAVAYIGRLFHNPASHNSLFFPATGGRVQSGALAYVGNEGSYWTSSSQNSAWGWTLHVDNTQAVRRGRGRYGGFAVRCVVDIEP